MNNKILTALYILRMIMSLLGVMFILFDDRKDFALGIALMLFVWQFLDAGEKLISPKND